MDEGVAGTVAEAEPAAAIAPVTGTATVAASARMGRRALRVMSLQTRAAARRTATLGGRSPHLSPRTSEVQKGSDPSGWSGGDAEARGPEGRADGAEGEAAAVVLGLAGQARGGGEGLGRLEEAQDRVGE